MGFRFQKRIRLGKFLTFNLSRKGASTSLGVTGARVTYGRGQKRNTLGVEGTGLSHTSIEKTGGGDGRVKNQKRGLISNVVKLIFSCLFILLCFACVVFTFILALILLK